MQRYVRISPWKERANRPKAVKKSSGRREVVPERDWQGAGGPKSGSVASYMTRFRTFRKADISLAMLRPSKFEGHRPTIRHGCRMALMVALNWSVECVKEECYGSRYFGGSVPHTGRGNRGTSRQ
ncbi:MAG: hypothetical protein BECKG1743F_GA0114225_106324, partial [Candidatus Kentron sp. G]